MKRKSRLGKEIGVGVAVVAGIGFLSLALAGKPNTANGKKLYKKYCVTCHGVKGNGAGPAGKSLKPHPTNFKKGKFKYGCSPSKIQKTIKKGVKGKPMPSFGKKLKATQVKDISYYILKSFVPKATRNKCIKKK